jgi:hypothetical protein
VREEGRGEEGTRKEGRGEEGRRKEGRRKEGRRKEGGSKEGGRKEGSRKGGGKKGGGGGEERRGEEGGRKMVWDRPRRRFCRWWCRAIIVHARRRAWGVCTLVAIVAGGGLLSVRGHLCAQCCCWDGGCVVSARRCGAVWRGGCGVGETFVRGSRRISVCWRGGGRCGWLWHVGGGLLWGVVCCGDDE